MPGGRRPRPLTRADLPDEFTPDTVRALDVATVRRLSHPHNGVLDADEQRAFDQAVRTVMADTTDRLEDSLRRARRGGPRGGYDPSLRRTFARTEERLEAQARQARDAFPQLTGGWDVPTADVPPTTGAPEPTSPAAAESEVAAGSGADDEISLGALESDIEQTSDMMELLERIASIEQQQLEHHRRQGRSDVRGVFFALVVSVAVVVAGVAPLVEAQPDERRLIALWTLVVCSAAGVVYAIVRAAQSRRD